AAPAEVGFVSPEVATGGPASEASDVYALAALTVWALSGLPPLGQLDLHGLTAGLGSGLAHLLRRSLAPDPAARPPLADLTRALLAGARKVEAAASELAEQKAAPGAAGAAQPEARISPLLAIVLALGSTFVFCGLLGVVLATWSGLPGGVQALLLLGITGGAFGCGRLLERKGFPSSGLGFLLLSAQLLWVNGVHLLFELKAADAPEPYIALGLLVCAACTLLAARRDSALAGTLAVVAATVCAVAVGITLRTGSHYGPLAFTGAVGVAFWAVSRGLAGWVPDRQRAVARPFLVGSLLWSLASLCVALGLSSWKPGALDLLWPYLLAAPAAAVALRAPLAPDRAILLVLVGLTSLSAPFVHGSVVEDHWGPEPLALYALAVALALSLASWACGALRARTQLPGRGSLAVLEHFWAWLGSLWVWGCAVVALAITERSPGALDLALPYGLVGLCLVAGRLPTLRLPAFLAATGLLLVVPSAQAVILELAAGPLLWTVGVGLCVLAAAFRWPALAGSRGAQLLAIVVGLTSVLLTPGMACLEHCWGRDGGALIADGLKHFGRVHESDLIFLSMPLGASLGLVGLGYLFSREAERKLPYRLLEAAGLLNAYALLTALSCHDLESDLVYIGLLLLGGLAAIALGAYGRRASYVAISALVLLGNLFLQYFAKLTAAGVPWGFLAVGFGVALLVLAILYERRVKGFLPQLREWR
ncbi:MAG TPA: hypothetical protein DEA08_31670, partial [Planctomycetes bacterium]|nr:hypothetical protein [Planctomycetota bacterium]